MAKKMKLYKMMKIPLTPEEKKELYSRKYTYNFGYAVNPKKPLGGCRIIKKHILEWDAV